MSNLEQTLSIIKPDAVERNLSDQIKNELKNLKLKNFIKYINLNHFITIYVTICRQALW